MDHAGMEQDRQDLERYRAGLPPLKRKEIRCYPITAREAALGAASIFRKALNKGKKK